MYVSDLEWLNTLVEGVRLVYSPPSGAVRPSVLLPPKKKISRPTQTRAQLAIKLKDLLDDFLSNREWTKEESEVINLVISGKPIKDILSTTRKDVLIGITEKIAEFRAERGYVPKEWSEEEGISL